MSVDCVDLSRSLAPVRDGTALGFKFAVDILAAGLCNVLVLNSFTFES